MGDWEGSAETRFGAGLVESAHQTWPRSTTIGLVRRIDAVPGGMHIGAGWDPHWHKPSDRFATFSDEDFRLGLNAAQTTLAAIAQLVNVNLKH